MAFTPLHVRLIGLTTFRLGCQMRRLNGQHQTMLIQKLFRRSAHKPTAIGMGPPSGDHVSTAVHDPRLPTAIESVRVLHA